MKKLLPLGTLLLFSWFQVFQLCDEAEDASVALVNYVHRAAQKGSELKTSQAPYDDVDASFPLVVGQSLTHNSAPCQFVMPEAHVTLVSHPAHDVFFEPLQLDRSPPITCFTDHCPSLPRLIFVRNPARCLAPPLA